jgi:hypothetical protein
MKFLVLMAIFVNCAVVNAQLNIQNRVLSTCGDRFTEGGVMIDFTFGETFTAALPLGSSYVFTQGFQQPLRRKIGILEPVVAVSELANFEFAVYPNPFLSEISLEIDEKSQLELFIYDNSGRLVHNSSLNDLRTSIDLSGISPGNYQLVLTDKIKQIGRMPILKID